MAGICLSLGDEPCPSSCYTCALTSILGLPAEFTLIPISQRDKLRLGGTGIGELPEVTLRVREGVALFQVSLASWLGSSGREGQDCFWQVPSGGSDSLVRRVGGVEQGVCVC